MKHYVYELRKGKLFYIGCRSCKCEPEQDKKYKGSGARCPRNDTILFGAVKAVLSVWDTREQAEAEEYRLISQFIGTFGCLNRRLSKRKIKRSNDCVQ